MFSIRDDIKDILGIAALVLLTVFAAMVQRWRDASHRLDSVIAERDRIAHDFQDYKTMRDRLEAQRDAASKGFQNEIEKLRSDIERRPVPVVRLCPQPAIQPVPTPSNAAAGLEPPATAPGVVSGSAGLPATQGADIGPGLGRLLDRADELSAQLRAILTLEMQSNGR